MTRVNQELIAFWNYWNGNFKTFLGGVVEKFNEKGHAYIPNYQMWVVPVMIFPLQDGREILSKIKTLEDEFQDRQAKLAKEYESKIKFLLGIKVKN